MARLNLPLDEISRCALGDGNIHNESRKISKRRMMFIALPFIWLCLSGQGIAADQQHHSLGFFPGDFLEYWASARLLLTGDNPYSPEQQLALQRSVVSNTNQALMMWNPPWTLFFILPFGLFSFPVAHALWSILILTCLLVCSAHLWRIYGGPADRYRIAWLVCFSVVPTYLTLYVKQIDPLVLLGIVGFLYYQERQQCWLAGLALTLVAIKPHLVYVFWVALILWILEHRQWRVMCGLAIGGAVAAIIPLLFVPGIFGHYIRLYSTHAAPKPFDWKTPTLSTALGLLFGPEYPWVRYVPPVLGLVWFIFYWKKQRVNWNWSREMPLLLLVSQAATVFAWVWDQILLLPVLICGAIWAIRGGPSRIVRASTLGFLMIDLAPILVMSGVLIPDGFSLFWMLPMFLLAYSLFRIQTSIRYSHSSPRTI
jgi:hypothetical protein